MRFARNAKLAAGFRAALDILGKWTALLEIASPTAGHEFQSLVTSHCFLISSKIRNLRILFLACSGGVCYVS